MTPPQITDAATLRKALAADRYLLFKHSPVCPISTQAFREYQAFVAAHPDMATGWLDVVAQRALSQEVAARTGVTHESPQALVLRSGAAAWHASHSRITRTALQEAV